MDKRTKKLIPFLLFILTFTGFLSTQIVWDSLKLKADEVGRDKQKFPVYESAFQALNLTTARGNSVDLKSEKAPIVVLNFWASWCLPCLKELPGLSKFQEKYKGRVKVIGINGDEEKPEMQIKKIEDKYKLSFESVVDSNSKISDKFLITAAPTSIVFSKGKAIFAIEKQHDFMNPEFLEMIEAELK
jgi:thiol-disulfide isomerase/thioredoxin